MTNDRNGIPLWKNAFDISRWKNQEKIEELLSEVNLMERVIKKYLKITQENFPNLTDHSIDHSKMLWEYANIIVGKKKKDYLTPLEGFILNSVFLLHDAGMCYSILNNLEDIKKDAVYTDYLGSSNTKSLDKELEKEAIFCTVRQNHGDYAIRIAVEALNNSEYFIASVETREEFGDVIGKIAKSHTCNINYIEREFGKPYSSPRFPSDWTVDQKKLSFILRTADAAHIDNLRTPKTLKMINEIMGESKIHWTFQKKIGFPALETDGFLFYSTNNPFKKDEQKAWWYCFNALKTLDNELKNAENYFISKKEIAFDTKGVKYIDDSIALGKYSIRTEGWDSINTTIRVSNPVQIASELGGIKLYRNKNIAVRELIQNSIDAIHLYRFVTEQNNLKVGNIKIELELVDGDYFLSILDNGIGMSQNLLTNELLDFGGSYWKSNKFYNDFKGLTSKGFESIGKFGIGFFSAFMLTKEITVTSWKYGENIEAMRTLDFYDGIFTNPILRLPTEKEKSKIIDRGTLIRLKLENDPSKKNGMIDMENFKSPSLKSLIQYYVPSVDVEIEIKELDGTINKIPPNSIDNLNYLELINYLYIKKNPFHSGVNIIYSGLDQNDEYRKLPMRVTEIKEKDVIFGRMAILPDKNDDIPVLHEGSATAIIMSKGIRVTGIPGLVGYINTDDVVSIKRDEVSKIVSYKSLKNWALKQIEYINNSKLEKLYKKQIQNLEMSFNLYDDNFPISKRKLKGFYKTVTIKEFKEYVKTKNSIDFFQENKNHKNLPKTCEGFINITFAVPFLKEIINENEGMKLNSSDKLIRKIIKSEWGNYDLKIENNIFSSSDDFYSTIWRFTKTKKIKK